MTIINPDGGPVFLSFNSIALSPWLGLFGEFDSVSVMNAGGGLVQLLRNTSTGPLPTNLSSGSSSPPQRCTMHAR